MSTIQAEEVTFVRASNEITDDEATSTSGYRVKILVVRSIIGVSLLGLWELIAGPGVNIGQLRLHVDPFFISRPSLIFSRLAEWTATGTLWFHLWITLQEMIGGFVLGAAAGIVVGFVLGKNAFLAEVLDPYIVAVYSLPKIALAPLVILWFGLGLEPKIVLAAIVVFFLVFYNAYTGVREVDRELVDVLRLMGASRWSILIKAELPSALTLIFLGLKMSVPYALIGAIVGEMMAANRGIGAVLQNSAGQFDTAGVFAALFVLMVVSTSLNALLQRSEGLVLRWKEAGR
ncbi:MAG: ABC transporter permease [Trueperaceae bacterium]